MKHGGERLATLQEKRKKEIEGVKLDVSPSSTECIRVTGGFR